MGWRDVKKGIKTIQRCSSKNVLSFRDVLQSAWIRCGFCFCDKTHRKLHNYRSYILWTCAIVFWTLFFIIS
jgi:hypothetical protein